MLVEGSEAEVRMKDWEKAALGQAGAQRQKLI